MTSDPKSPGALFDAHCAAEFETRDIDATMATMGGCPHITNVPTMTGGYGRDAVRRFAAVMRDASAYSNANPHEMAKYLAPYFHQDVAALARTDPALLGTVLDAAELQPIVDAAQRYGMIAKGFPAAELIAAR